MQETSQETETKETQPAIDQVLKQRTDIVVATLAGDNQKLAREIITRVASDYVNLAEKQKAAAELLQSIPWKTKLQWSFTQAAVNAVVMVAVGAGTVAVANRLGRKSESEATEGTNEHPFASTESVEASARPSRRGSEHLKSAAI